MEKTVRAGPVCAHTCRMSPATTHRMLVNTGLFRGWGCREEGRLLSPYSLLNCVPCIYYLLQKQIFFFKESGMRSEDEKGRSSSGGSSSTIITRRPEAPLLFWETGSEAGQLTPERTKGTCYLPGGCSGFAQVRPGARKDARSGCLHCPDLDPVSHHELRKAALCSRKAEPGPRRDTPTAGLPAYKPRHVLPNIPGTSPSCNSSHQPEEHCVL